MSDLGENFALILMLKLKVSRSSLSIRALPCLFSTTITGVNFGSSSTMAWKSLSARKPGGQKEGKRFSFPRRLPIVSAALALSQPGSWRSGSVDQQKGILSGFRTITGGPPNRKESSSEKRAQRTCPSRKALGCLIKIRSMICSSIS
jgi:hypothetical protein